MRVPPAVRAYLRRLWRRMRFPPRLHGYVQLLRRRIRHRRRTLAELAGGALGIVTLLLGFPAQLTVPVAVVTAVAFVHGAWSVGSELRDLVVDSRSIYLSHADRGLWLRRLRRQSPCDGWRLRQFSGRSFITDRDTNRFLASTLVPVTIETGRFVLDDEISKHANAVLAAKMRSGAVLYDSRVMRLASDVLRDGHPVTLQETTYFDAECTNETTALNIYRRGPDDRGRRLFSGADLLAENRTVFNIRTSPCANAIGVSTVAITRDGRLVVVHQGERSAQSAGQLAPSGSGSAEPQDAEGARTLQAFAARAMRREFREECGLKEWGGATSTLVIGYARDMDRGGKPEFFGVTRVDADFDVLRRVSREFPFVAAIDPAMLTLSHPDEVLGSLKDFREERLDELSLALRLNLHFLGAIVVDDWPRIRDFLHGGRGHWPA